MKQNKYVYVLFFSLIGLSTGVLMAFSESPTIVAVISILITLVVIITALASGINDLRLLPSFRKDDLSASQENKIQLSESFSPLFLTLLITGLTFGALFGIYLKNNAKIFRIDIKSVVNMWYEVCQADIKGLIAAERAQSMGGDSIDLRHIERDSLALVIHNLQVKQEIGILLFSRYYNLTFDSMGVNSVPNLAEKTSNKSSEDYFFKSQILNLSSKAEKSGESRTEILPIVGMVKSKTVHDIDLHTELIHLIYIPDSAMRVHAENSENLVIRELSKSIPNDKALKSVFKILWKDL